jgi:hypothetical protein
MTNEMIDLRTGVDNEHEGTPASSVPQSASGVCVEAWGQAHSARFAVGLAVRLGNTSCAFNAMIASKPTRVCLDDKDD